MRSITSKTIILGLALIFLPYGELRANEGAIATLTASDVTTKKDEIKKEMNSEECYDPANIGKIGKPEWTACADMLIVDYSMLYSAASEVIGGNESFTIHHKGRSFTFSQDGNDIFTGQMTDMPGLFQKTNFTGDIEYWDVSNVTDMSNMFYNADAFNQPLADWDVSNVTDMSYMFYNADAFNQPLADWNVSNVTDMSYMFYNTDAFNQPLADWNVSNVTDMSSMFYNADAFNQSLADWDVSNVSDMSNMFEDADAFNQPLADWDVSNVTNMSLMFFRANSFNQPLADWDVGNVTNMKAMFTGANAFNQLLADWDVGNVKKCASFAPSLKASNKPNFSECD